MILDVRALNSSDLEQAARQFAQVGYIELEGLEQRAVPAFRALLAEKLAIDHAELQRLITAEAGHEVFPTEVRQALSRIATTPVLAATLVDLLRPLMARLIGPLAHVSRDFHSQFKGGATPGIDHYHHEMAAEYLELHGAYLLHQDFTGASLPTSPSGLTLWCALNDCDASPLRLFPGSHRLGMVCNRMWKLDDPRLAALAAPLEVRAREGRGVLFNSMLIHGTGESGTQRRVSCDIRFFPLCGFLGSQVHALSESPLEALAAGLRRAEDEVLRSPLLEALVYLDRPIEPPPAAPLSRYHWLDYIRHRLDGDPERARADLDQMANTELSGELPEAFGRAWHKRELDLAALEAVRRNGANWPNQRV